VAQIEWRSFQAADGSEVPQHALTVRISGGNLRVMLVPTTDALKPAYYTVKFNSDGRTQFTEYWSVPPTSAPLHVKDVRSSGPVAGPITDPVTPIPIADVAGLRTELDLRPARGATFTASRAAMIGATGAIESVIGNPGDCVRVDGTSGPCGTEGGGGTEPPPGQIVFIDGEVPQGVINGANQTFALTGAPYPALSLRLYRNGMLLRQGVEYTISENIVSIAPSVIPQPGDSLQAWYRLVPTGTPTVEFVDGEVPLGLVDGSNRVFNLNLPPLPASSLQVYRNGLLQKPGEDYQLSVNTLTFFAVSTPQPGDLLQVWYRK
jgi:hypothetical protein